MINYDEIKSMNIYSINREVWIKAWRDSMAENPEPMAENPDEVARIKKCKEVRKALEEISKRDKLESSVRYTDEYWNLLREYRQNNCQTVPPTTGPPQSDESEK